MEIQPPASFPYGSKREETDEQMRRKLRDLRQILAFLFCTASVHSAVDFHSMNTIQRLTSFSQSKFSEARSSPSILADVAPITRWDCDVLHQERIV